MAADSGEIERVIGEYQDPYLERTLADAKAVKGVTVANGKASVMLDLGFPLAGYRDELAAALRERVLALPSVREVEFDIKGTVISHAVQRNLKPIQFIKNIIAVASGKGGVGKSTVAVNLALALSAEGARVGLLDADIYGPSQPLMLGLRGAQPKLRTEKQMEPLEAYGVSAMSIGFLIDEEQPMVWRGPMVTQALTQLIGDTHWGELDYLVVDMPPGTGDTQLTLSQRVPVSGVVIVTTPQDIALLDARKGLKMFQKVEVEILGVVENMSTHVCSQCGHEESIFGAGGGQRLAEQYGVPFLGSLPLDIRIREEADGGKPSVVADPEGVISQAYRAIARRAAAKLALAGKDYSHLFPKVTIEES